MQRELGLGYRSFISTWILDGLQCVVPPSVTKCCINDSDIEKVVADDVDIDVEELIVSRSCELSRNSVPFRVIWI